MSLWLALLAIGLLTYAMRLVFILLLGRVRFPDWLVRALRFVPPAVLTAIIFPEVFLAQGRLDMSLGNPRWLAGAIAALVAWRTRNVVLTVLAGMVALLLLQAWI